MNFDWRITPGSGDKLRQGFAFLLMAAGLGICVLYGTAWVQRPHYDAAQRQVLARIQVLNQIAKNPASAPKNDNEAKKQIAQARKHVDKHLSKQRTNLIAGFIAGAGLLLIGLWQWFASRNPKPL